MHACRRGGVLIPPRAPLVGGADIHDRGRGSKLCSVRFRPCHPRDASGSPFDYYQVGVDGLHGILQINACFIDPATHLTLFSSAILAHATLNEKLNVYGMLGCLLCITGSLSIALHAPPERPLGSVIEVWQLAMQPGGTFI